MTRWIVYKHRFLYTGKYRGKEPAEPHTLEFIVTVKGKTMNEKTLKKEVLRIFETISNEIKSNEGRKMNLILYDFGKLSWSEILDDIRKLFILEYPKRTGTKVQLWLDKPNDISIWDDGDEPVKDLPHPSTRD